jgi:uncharacterized SAM-binding protein YcdF (DUF218 family)
LLRRDPALQADAIVVLGCPPSARLSRRVERGVRLYQQGAAPVLLLSGGGRRAEPEALTMRRAALAAGVPENAVLVEPASRDTLGNARETLRLLRAHRLRSVVLVSDRTHLPRATLLFRLAGIEIAGSSGVRPRSVLLEIAAALRELGALPWSLARAISRR